MRIAVSGGGTAGHVSPVLATVDALRARNPHVQFVYIGQASGMEAELVRAAGLRFVGIRGGKFRRLPGAPWWHNLLDVANLARNLIDLVNIAIGSLQAWWLLRRFRPDAVFNKGGPPGLPVGLACRWLRIPMVIHEPDVTPGLGNRILSRRAAAIAVGFPERLYPQFPAAKLHYTGNPVQPEALAGERAGAHQRFGLHADRPVVLVVGGSQGAERVNSAIVAILPQLLEQAQIVHVIGARDYKRVCTAVADLALTRSDDYHPLAFLPIAELGDAYAAATIVVSRAGANTLAELAALAKPAILLPNHQAAAHQLANAAWLAEAGAAVVLTDEQPQPLLAAIRELLDSQPRRDQLAEHLAACAVPDAPQRLAELVLAAANKPAANPTDTATKAHTTDDHATRPPR